MTPKDIRNLRFRRIVENTFKADATLDPDLFVAGLTSDGLFRLGGRPPMRGRTAIRAMLVETFAAFRSVQHTLHRAYEFQETLIYQAHVRYEMKSSAVVEADYANILQFQRDLVSDYRVYIDLSVMNG